MYVTKSSGLLDNKIAQLEKRVQKLRNLANELERAEGDLEALRRARAILSGEFGPQNNRPASALTIADAAEQILREANGSLHADQLLERVTGIGVVTTKATLVAALTKEESKGKRFVNLGRNVFVLREFNDKTGGAEPTGQE